MSAAVLMMQKDEGTLLESWLNFYNYVYGMDNIYLFDNGSVDPLTNAILKEWISKGLKVFQHPGPLSFENKGAIILNKIKEINHQYDYFFPVDCDEFIVKFLNPSSFKTS